MKRIFFDEYDNVNFFGFLCFIFGIGAVVVAALTAICIGLAYWSDSKKCETMHVLMGVETNVSVNAGCLIKYKGDWVRADAVTGNQIEVRTK